MIPSRLEYGKTYLLQINLPKDAYRGEQKGVYLGFRDNGRTRKNHVILIQGKRKVLAYRFADYSLDGNVLRTNSLKRSGTTRYEKDEAKRLFEK